MVWRRKLNSLISVKVCRPLQMYWYGTICKRSRIIPNHQNLELRLQTLTDNGNIDNFGPCEPANYGFYLHLHIPCELLPKFAHPCHPCLWSTGCLSCKLLSSLLECHLVYYLDHSPKSNNLAIDEAVIGRSVERGDLVPLFRPKFVMKKFWDIFLPVFGVTCTAVGFVMIAEDLIDYV